MPIQEWSPGIWLVQLNDDPSFAEELDMLHDRLRRADEMPHVVLDLSEVNHLNSSNLSQLLRLRKTAVDREAQIRLATPCDAVWAVFIATGLDKVFDFTPDTPTALAELQLSDAE
ncbi:STAS domain-containing protein [Mucisphaera calidilacus]|uniref:STAS domain protein n=1 Tax=Mucisphaera calidilacus TaxID=2527982 RepID=A0A518BXF0_9BACT|nr:STAS domain-containing protein [Mucisphaera calidilacus]QDU71624.1 STAS domain protein [Mucisphaera calidilacus]